MVGIILLLSHILFLYGGHIYIPNIGNIIPSNMRTILYDCSVRACID